MVFEEKWLRIDSRKIKIQTCRSVTIKLPKTKNKEEIKHKGKKSYVTFERATLRKTVNFWREMKKPCVNGMTSLK